jgi:hypothetical protein
MAGVDDDDDVAAVLRRGRQGRRAPYRRRAFGAGQIDDEPMALLLTRREQKSLRFHRCIELEHQAQLAAGARADTKSSDRAVDVGQR